MPTLGEKIRRLRENRKMTQYKLGEALMISEDAVQKWEKDKNTPPVKELINICNYFGINIIRMLNENVEVGTIREIDRWEGNLLIGKDTPHIIYDADLKNEAVLHRFNNPAGVPYSAIYQGRTEIASCERGEENNMLAWWFESN